MPPSGRDGGTSLCGTVTPGRRADARPRSRAGRRVPRRGRAWRGSAGAACRPGWLPAMTNGGRACWPARSNQQDHILRVASGRPRTPRAATASRRRPAMSVASADDTDSTPFSVIRAWNCCCSRAVPGGRPAMCQGPRGTEPVRTERTSRSAAGVSGCYARKCGRDRRRARQSYARRDRPGRGDRAPVSRIRRERYGSGLRRGSRSGSHWMRFTGGGQACERGVRLMDGHGSYRCDAHRSRAEEHFGRGPVLRS